MTSKSMKPTPAPKREMTPEEKEQQALRAYAMKREQFATSILFGMVHNANLGMTPNQAVEWAINAADQMLDRLYPGIVKKEESK